MSTHSDHLTPWDAPKPSSRLHKQFKSFALKRAMNSHSAVMNAMRGTTKPNNAPLKMRFLTWLPIALWAVSGLAQIPFIFFPGPHVSTESRIFDGFVAGVDLTLAGTFAGKELGKKSRKRHEHVMEQFKRAEIEQEIRDEYRKKFGV